jgi:hypothetical protein
MAVNIACIVEGHGEREAAPLLVRRVAAEIDPQLIVNVTTTLRVPKSRLLKPGEMERTVDLAARTLNGPGAVWVLIDGDEDCPAELGPTLLQRACQARSDVPIAVVIAKCEFEAWFLAAAASLRGQRGLSTTVEPPPEPEAVHDAKGWLAERMASGHYSETRDQPAFAAQFDLHLARRADSFDKCYRDLVRLLTGSR